MPLTQLELNTVSKGLAIAKKMLDEVKPVLDALNIIYDSVGGAKSTITQAGLDLVPYFSGITKQQLDDGMFALTATLRTDMQTAYAVIAQLAARA